MCGIEGSGLMVVDEVEELGDDVSRSRWDVLCVSSG